MISGSVLPWSIVVISETMSVGATGGCLTAAATAPPTAVEKRAKENFILADAKCKRLVWLVFGNV